jgi:uracil phosphoribosyltransferase
MRSGEAMEQGLRDCCRSIRIGKILIMSDEETHEAKVYYAKFPSDVHKRKVLLMYPIMCTGKSVVKALEVLRQHNVSEDKIVLLTLFTTPDGLRYVMSQFPLVKILTSEVHPSAPSHFGQRYFGTD